MEGTAEMSERGREEKVVLSNLSLGIDVLDERLFLLALLVGLPTYWSSSKVCEKMLEKPCVYIPFQRGIYTRATYSTAKMLMCRPTKTDYIFYIPAFCCEARKHSDI